MTVKITQGHAHLDGGTLASPKKMENGWMRADAYLTRSGVFQYKNPDGTKRREYRPADEVFKTDSLDTLKSLPVTDDHPPVLLTGANTSEHARGALGETIRKDGDKIAAGMLVTDSALVAKMERGDAQEVSCGYVCDLEWSPGTAPNGERYDAIQRNIKYNHVALLPRGRAGSEVRVRMDAAELDVVLDLNPAAPTEQNPMRNIRIDGIDYPADSDAAVQAMARHDEKVRADAALLTKAQADMQAAMEGQAKKFDAAMAEIEKMRKDAAEAPAKIRAELEARTALEASARKVLGSKVKLDGLDEKAVQLKVLAKLAPKAKMDGKDEAYISARFDSEVERFTVDASETEEPTEERVDNDESEEKEERFDADESRKKMIANSEAAWKQPVGASLNSEGRGVKVAR